MESFFHSVKLDSGLCVGCTNCVKRCPTASIRVQDGKAHILRELCIDCGQCIYICPHHAKRARFTHLSKLSEFEYNIALPAPSLYGQFNNLDDVNIVLNALVKMGFDDVFEVSAAAELVSEATRQYISEHEGQLPLISTACPSVVRLIRVRFPNLIPHLLPLNPPVEVAGILAAEKAMKDTGLPREKIGIMFISPCPSKVTYVKSPLGTEKSQVDHVLAIKDVYPKLLACMKAVGSQEDYPQIGTAGKIGISWGHSGGEASGLFTESYLAADGIENVIRVLEDMEDQKFTNLRFVELNACNGGCVGGVLTVENPYVAKAKLKRILKYRPVSCNHLPGQSLEEAKDLFWEEPVEYDPVMELDPDIRVAMEKLQQMQEIEGQLYGMDCGSCGAPSCRALAEDIVRGYSTQEACIYKLREEIQTIADGLRRLSAVMPRTAADQEKSEKEETP